MMRLLAISVLLVAVNAEYSVDEFLGEWLPGVTYPKTESTGLYCHWFSFKNEYNVKCTCGGNETPAMKLRNVDEKIDKSVPVVVIGENEDADSKLKTCICNGIHLYPFVLKKINANYFVGYGAESHGDGMEYFSVVFMKKVPKLVELQAFLNSVSDLRGKEPAYMCPLSYFA